MSYFETKEFARLVSYFERFANLISKEVTPTYSMSNINIPPIQSLLVASGPSHYPGFQSSVRVHRRSQTAGRLRIIHDGGRHGSEQALTLAARGRLPRVLSRRPGSLLLAPSRQRQRRGLPWREGGLEQTVVGLQVAVVAAGAAVEHADDHDGAPAAVDVTPSRWLLAAVLPFCAPLAAHDRRSCSRLWFQFLNVHPLPYRCTSRHVKMQCLFLSITSK